ncbi:hypothetical protein N9B24_03030 [bacterium]|nr:hypothetical protein [bacterium]
MIANTTNANPDRDGDLRFRLVPIFCLHMDQTAMKQEDSISQFGYAEAVTQSIYPGIIRGYFMIKGTASGGLPQAEIAPSNVCCGCHSHLSPATEERQPPAELTYL